MSRERNRFDRPTLPGDPAATMYMDGLMILYHDAGAQLAQAAVHVQAPHHELTIAVFNRADQQVWPNDDEPWDGSHANVRRIEPLWLFVTSNPDTPPPPPDFSASLHNSGDQAFSHVLDFEGRLFSRKLDFHRNRIAVLNMPHGVFYSARNEMSELHTVETGFETNITASVLGAADIDRAVADRFIVLWQSRPLRRLFSIPLRGDEHYEIHVLNIPTHGSGSTRPEEHFLQYYHLFERREGERRFFPRPRPHTPPKRNRRNPDSPPCDITQGSITDSLP